MTESNKKQGRSKRLAKAYLSCPNEIHFKASHMDITTKMLKDQVRITKSSFSTPAVFAKMLHTPRLKAIIDPFLQRRRRRLYGPIETLGMFVSQALSPDRSCGTSLERLLTLIAQRQVGDRPGRIEPRVIKRRHRNDYRLMMKPRDVLREEIRLNGHPKKVKQVPF